MRTFIRAMVVIAFILTACGQRNLETPADRLVGHWTNTPGDHKYYSRANADGVGSYILVQFDGNTARHEYKIVSQIPAGERVILQLWFSDGTRQINEYMLSRDGRELEETTVIDGTEITTGWWYVDNKIEP